MVDYRKSVQQAETKAQGFFARNRKACLIVGAAIVVIVIAILAKHGG